jgi:flavin reductase ActVB
MMAWPAVNQAVERLRGGGSVIVCDGEVCAIAAAAELIEPSELNRFTHLGGVLGVAMAAERLDHLGIEPMVRTAGDWTAATVSVDAANGGTGISVSDRLETLRALAVGPSGAGLVSPGHVFPLRVDESGGRITGIPAACVALARAAGLAPAVAFCVMLDADGNAVRPADLRRLPAAEGPDPIGVEEVDGWLRGAAGVAIDKESFRSTMARLVSGVAAVTVRDESRAPRGLLVTSVTPYSDSPPSVLVCVAHSSRTHDPLSDAAEFGVHLLGCGQERIAAALSGRGSDKFEAIDWHWDHDVPRIAGVAAYLRCVKTTSLIHGDHTILIGNIEAAENTGSDPLVYFERSFDWVLTAASASFT